MPKRTMTRNDQKELCRLERVIEKGLHTFVEVGKALMEIRDKCCSAKTTARSKTTAEGDGVSPTVGPGN